MHIVMLVDSMDVGGAETHIYELSRLLVLRGHRVTVLSSGGTTAHRLAAVGVGHRTLPDALSPAVVASLARLIREEKPHVIHAHTRRRAFLCRLLLSQMDFPMVFTAHALFDARFPKNLASFFPPHVIAVSRDVKEHLVRRFGVPSASITVIANGVDTSPVPATSHRPFTILSVSRQDQDSHRTAALLCAIAPALQAALPFPIRILIAGGGEALPKLREAAQRANARCGKEVVRLLGAVTDPRPLYGACHLFVGVSRAAMEAMSAAKPVILCGDQGYLGILDRTTLPRAAKTNLCARGEKAAGAEDLLRDLVAVAKMPKEKRDALGTFSRATALCRYSAEQMARETEQVYEHARARFRASRTSDAVVCGYYGYGNCGDELILRRLLEGQSTARLRLAVMTADGSAPKGAVGVPRYHPSSVLRALRTSGALIMGGGSLLQDATSRRSLLYYLSLILAARGMGLPVMLYANGIGPLSDSSQALCRKILRGADLITLRDTDSLRAVLAMGLPRTRVVLGADPVLCDADKHKSDAPPLRRIALFPHGHRTHEEQMRLADSVAALAVSLQLDVAVAAMNPREDSAAVRKICDRIAKRLSAHPHLHAVVASADPDAILRLVERSSLVIGERLHALILAFRAGVPSVGVGSDPKIGSFLREIHQSRCFLRTNSPQDLIIAAKVALSHPQDKQIAKDFAVRARRDATLARNLILRGE